MGHLPRFFLLKIKMRGFEDLSETKRLFCIILFGPPPYHRDLGGGAIYGTVSREFWTNYDHLRACHWYLALKTELTIARLLATGP